MHMLSILIWDVGVWFYMHPDPFYVTVYAKTYKRTANVFEFEQL